MTQKCLNRTISVYRFRDENGCEFVLAEDDGHIFVLFPAWIAEKEPREISIGNEVLELKPDKYWTQQWFEVVDFRKGDIHALPKSDDFVVPISFAGKYPPPKRSTNEGFLVMGD